MKTVTRESQPHFDPECYLCPGNVRAGGHVNPLSTGVYVFDNDFPALLPDSPGGRFAEGELSLAESERGRCRVVCFSPRHDLTISRMGVPEIRQVVDTWAELYVELGRLPFINHVQIFENRGALMGASDPHPHCQIWAQEHLPNEVVDELRAQSDYLDAHDANLLAAYLALELTERERLVAENAHFVALVPFWAVWPFETLIVSRRHVTGFDLLGDEERESLAGLLWQLTIRYDNLFRASFPYTMGFHGRPTEGAPHEEYHLHAHFYPPLLRSVIVHKFMVGYEMLGMPPRDVTPEEAAMRLREVPAKHYLDCTRVRSCH